MREALRLENCLLRPVCHALNPRADGGALENEIRTGMDQSRAGMGHLRSSGGDSRKGGGQPLRLMLEN